MEICHIMILNSMTKRVVFMEIKSNPMLMEDRNGSKDEAHLREERWK